LARHLEFRGSVLDRGVFVRRRDLASQTAFAGDLVGVPADRFRFLVRAASIGRNNPAERRRLFAGPARDRIAWSPKTMTKIGPSPTTDQASFLALIDLAQGKKGLAYLMI
jgi:hypothetical protein